MKFPCERCLFTPNTNDWCTECTVAMDAERYRVTEARKATYAPLLAVLSNVTKELCAPCAFPSIRCDDCPIPWEEEEREAFVRLLEVLEREGLCTIHRK